jgi:flagellar biosynthesis/type III secretory pathway M-ring protein FliF/YscJ
VPAESQASRLLADAAQTSSEARRRVGVTVNQQPDMAAKVVRAWMKEA